MKEIDIVNKIYADKRITKNESINIYKKLSLTQLGKIAQDVRLKKTNPKVASYIIDRNINYTDVCVVDCKFCAFYKRTSDPKGYVLPNTVIQNKILEAYDLGATGILLQGGLNPRLKLDYYTKLLKDIKSTCKIHVHAFSPPEIQYLARLEKKSIKKIIQSLIEAGLDSIPGGGAEILVDSVRDKISPKKCTSSQWMEVMEEAHKLNLKTTATMMMGHVETLEDRLEHLQLLRDLQDKTNGFTAFIPWSYEQSNTPLKTDIKYSYEYLKTLAISRIFLDNFKNIQGSWLTQGKQIGRLSLYFGANDLGSIMIEENVVRLAGTNHTMTEKEIQNIIEECGFKAFKRNTLYTNMMDEKPNAYC